MPKKNLPTSWSENKSKPADWGAGIKKNISQVSKDNVTEGNASAKSSDETTKVKSTNLQSKTSENTEDSFEKNQEELKSEQGNLIQEPFITKAEYGDSFYQSYDDEKTEDTELLEDVVDVSNFIVKNNKIENKKAPISKPQKMLKVSTVVLIVLLTLSVSFLAVFIVLFFTGHNAGDLLNSKDDTVLTGTTEAITIPTSTVAESTIPQTTEEPDTEAETEATSYKDGFNSYTMTVNAQTTIYKSPSYSSDVVDVIEENDTYTIVDEYYDESTGDIWGKLESGIGWINYYDATYSYEEPEYIEPEYIEPEEIAPNASTGKILIDDYEFEYIYKHSDEYTHFTMNNITIEPTSTIYNLGKDEYLVKIDASISDDKGREKYFAYFEYDSDGNQLGKYYLSTDTVDGRIKNTYNCVIMNKDTTHIYIDVAM